MKRPALGRYVYIVLGVLLFGVGAIGTVLPLIPTTPFIVLSAVCFGKSSQKLHEWCINTRFYKSNVESFVKKRAMTIKAKTVLLATVTAVMGISFVVMTFFSAPLVIKIILAVIWLCHLIYFGVIVKINK